MFNFWGPREPGEVLYSDRFRSIEVAVTFRKIKCYQCDFEAIYKYRVQQVRRHAEIQVQDGEEVRPDHIEIWKTIPRFAEIPETVKCKRCKEVLGVYPLCVY